MAELYAVAKAWETASDAERVSLKGFVTRLVGYPCKVACEPTETGVDLIVFNEKKGRVMDYLEIQPTGAIGVLDGEYEDSELKRADALWARCDAQNEQAGVTYVVDDGEEAEDEESGEDEEESDDDDSDHQ